ncbi:MAG TPA: alpha/beta hydrolase [Thermoanaerobaculia bacterium]|nr:alpha/beta hydrolase [Thermoanaerobaculia bacterium]
MKLESGKFLDRVPYARVGAKPDPILVLAGGQAFVQRPTRERMERDAGRVARLLPTGRSFLLLGYDPALPGGDSLDGIVADIVAITREIGAPRQLVGISYGGVIALRLAAQHPDLVSALALLASAHDFSAEGKRRIERQIDCASRGDLAALVEGYASVFRRPWLNGLLRVRLRARRGRLSETMNSPPTIIRGLRAILDPRLADTTRLARVTARTLILGGSRDQFFGDGMLERTAAALPNASLALFPGETHMLPVERARAVAARLRAFLRD